MSVERAVIFGREAENYDHARPSYPAEVIDIVVGHQPKQQILEIGAGTGLATVDVARSGFDITCLEPSSQMAHVLDIRELVGVEVIVETFEEWEGASNSLDLIYAAQSWHWVDHDQGYPKAIRLLRPGGVVALFWNVVIDRYKRFEDLYRELAPQIIEEWDERIHKRDHHNWSAELEEAGFADVKRFTHRWSDTLSAVEYRNLCSSYSDHMLVPDERQVPLLDTLQKAVEDDGGLITVDYRTELFTGRAI